MIGRAGELGGLLHKPVVGLLKNNISRSGKRKQKKISKRYWVMIVMVSLPQLHKLASLTLEIFHGGFLCYK